jgi:hypothetical protein
VAPSSSSLVAAAAAAVPRGAGTEREAAAKASARRRLRMAEPGGGGLGAAVVVQGACGGAGSFGPPAGTAMARSAFIFYARIGPPVGGSTWWGFGSTFDDSE